MKEPWVQKVINLFSPLLRKLLGHEYGCCSWGRCSKCKYIKIPNDKR